MKIHYNSRFVAWLPKGTLAYTFGEHVFVRGPTAWQDLLLHEAKHVLQFRKYGVLGFTVRHVYFDLRYGYALNPLEIEARAFAAERIARCSFAENSSFLASL